MIKKTLFLALLFAAIVACSSDDDSQDIQGGCQSTIPFFAEGRSFQYNFNVLGQDTPGSISIGACNGSAYAVERVTPLGSGTDLWRQNGDFIEVDSEGNGDYWALLYKADAQLGDTWSHTQPDGDIVTHTVISVDSTITVPAGTFTCKVFSYTNTGIINTSYIFWDDNVGQIKENAGFISSELVSYQ